MVDDNTSHPMPGPCLPPHPAEKSCSLPESGLCYGRPPPGGAAPPQASQKAPGTGEKLSLWKDRALQRCLSRVSPIRAVPDPQYKEQGLHSSQHKRGMTKTSSQGCSQV